METLTFRELRIIYRSLIDTLNRPVEPIDPLPVFSLKGITVYVSKSRNGQGMTLFYKNHSFWTAPDRSGVYGYRHDDMLWYYIDDEIIKKYYVKVKEQKPETKN